MTKVLQVLILGGFMKIEYLHIKEITQEQLFGLFDAVQWESAKYPEEIQVAIKNSHRVITAWDGDELVGLINSLSDGVMTVYFHYMLVRPEYQGRGIGRKLLDIMLKEYTNYRTKVLIAYDHAVDFYISCGFKQEQGTIPLFISDLV